MNNLRLNFTTPLSQTEKSPDAAVQAFQDCLASQDFLAILREQGFEPI